ncbi:MAG: tetratricopeptide repeat protein [Planctomycetes bacterium]|nr:tetratricopeptide repeat protein [Planctomycetota bacterium]
MTVRPRLVLVVSLALLAAACGDDQAARQREAEARDAMKADIEKARKDLDKATQEIQAAKKDARALRDEVTALMERVSAVEKRPVAGASAAPAATDTGSANAAKAIDKKALLEEMKSLQEKVFDGTATDDEQQRFWELARTASVVDEMMKTLEAKVKDRPEDTAARMQLAQAYIAKLLSIPQGPEQGLWSNKAVAQWQTVLKQEPDNWDARYSVAFNWSMWPDFLNKTPDAIREFEKTREVQERQTADPKHAQTYLQLSRLYQKQGKSDKAKEALKSGLARHPDDAELKKALESLAD